MAADDTDSNSSMYFQLLVLVVLATMYYGVGA
jgi:hypothetical protein